MMFTRGWSDGWVRKPTHHTLSSALSVGDGSHLFIFKNKKLFQALPLEGKDSAQKLFGMYPVNPFFYMRWAEILKNNHPELLGECD